MFTNKFKATLAVAVAVLVAGGLGLNQASLQKQVDTLKVTPVVVKVSPTTEPTATPSATPTTVLKYTPSHVLPTALPKVK